MVNHASIREVVLQTFSVIGVMHCFFKFVVKYLESYFKDGFLSSFKFSFFSSSGSRLVLIFIHVGAFLF